MPYLCECWDVIFITAMLFLLLVFIVSQVVIYVKLDGLDGLPMPPKRKGE